MEQDLFASYYKVLMLLCNNYVWKEEFINNKNKAVDSSK